MIDKPEGHADQQDGDGNSGEDSKAGPHLSSDKPHPQSKGYNPKGHTATAAHETYAAPETTLRRAWSIVPKKSAFWSTLATVVMAITTGVYTYYAKEQWREMKNSRSDTRESLTSVQRAFITFPAETNMLYFTDPHDKARVVYWEFGFPIENSGATPTKAMRDHVSMHISKGPIPADFVLQDKASGQDIPMIVGPKARIASPTLRVTAKELVEKNPPHVYLYGWATYHDIFSSTTLHLTKFCKVFRFTGNPVAATTEGLASQGSLCAIGNWQNCADEDCPDYKQFASAEKPN
jgi:hypothetical protein